MKNIVYVGVICMSIGIIHTEQSAPNRPGSEQFINDLFTNISGFSIPTTEREKIGNEGGAATYGEITYDSLKKVLDNLRLKNNDVFYDLGSGVGKVVVQVFLTSPVKKAAGVELSTTRFQHAQKVRARLAQEGFITPNRTLAFIEDNILNENLSDATVIFMCSLCFSDQLMNQLTQKFSLLKPGLRVVTLRHLPEGYGFSLVKELSLPMTWSQSTPVYIYQLK